MLFEPVDNVLAAGRSKCCYLPSESLQLVKVLEEQTYLGNLRTLMSSFALVSSAGKLCWSDSISC